MRLLRPAFLFALLMLVPAAGARAAADMPGPGPLAFAVMRDGSRIGTHRVSFRQVDGQLVVTAKLEVEVGIAFITLYRFTKSRREVWRDGRLMALDATTDDDGDLSSVRARATDRGLEVEGPAGRFTAPADILPSGYWNPRTVEQTRLLDGEDGTVMEIAVSGGEAATISVGGQPVEARHYRITGDTERELWYGADGVWLGMREVVRDGSTIEYVPLAPGAE